MGKIITTYPSLKGKQLPYPDHFQKLEIWGGGDSAKAHGERFSPEHVHKHLDRAWLEFICLTPSPYPAKKEEGVMLWTPA